MGAASTTTTGGVLLCRERELARLSALLDGALSGDGSLVWLLGEAGIGKSALAAEAVKAGEERGMVSFVGAAQELFRHRPLTLIADALEAPSTSRDSRRRQAAGLLHRSRPVSQEGAELNLQGGGELEAGSIEAMVAVLEDACATSPTVLVLDDLQWADDSSLRFLAELAALAPELALVVICSARPVPRRPELERLIALSAERGAQRIELEPLDGEASEALAAQLAGAHPGPSLRRLLGRCGGNPLFVRYLMQALEADGALERGGEGVDTSAAEVPPSLHATALALLAGLSEDAQDVLRLAAVLGGAFTAGDLALVTGHRTAELWGALREALATGALREDGERLSFAHDVVREALYQDVPGAVRIGLHHDFASALAERGADATLVAEHLLHGSRKGDRDAAAWLERAATEVAPRSAAAAAELLRAALELLDDDDPERPRLSAALAVSLISAGQREAGERLCRELLASGSYPAGEGSLRLMLARSLLERGHVADALAEADRAARSPTVGEAERAQALAWAIQGPLLAHQLDTAQAAAERALVAAERAGSLSARAFVLTGLAHLAAFRGEFRAQERLGAKALEAACQAGTSEAHAASHAHLKYACALADLDRAVEGIEMVNEGRRVYQQLGMEEALRNSHHYADYPLLLAGRWDEALTEAQTALSLSERSGISYTVDVLARQAIIRCYRGELEIAAALIARAQAALDAGAPEFRMGWVAWAHALLEEARSNPDSARERLWRACGAATELGVLYEQRAFAPDLARMLAAAGDRPRLAELAGAVDALARRNPEVGSLAALASRVSGLAHEDVAELARACDLYTEAAYPYERGLAHEDAAVALVTSDRAAATQHADRAFELYTALGAEQAAARAAARLRAAGLRRGSRGSRRRPDHGWASLTPSERRVAELAADGLSNPQIAERLVISRHTVATHIAHILTKLGLRSRYELAAGRAAADAPAADARSDRS